MIESEVIIVGGGPAGSTCARKLKQKGVETLILDKQDFPRFKPCAGWITPQVFKDLQVEVNDYPYGLKGYNKLHIRLRGKRLFIPTRQYAIRRYEFDQWLLERSGVEVHQHTVKNIKQENGFYIIDDSYRCKYLVGAGGTNCPVYHTFLKEKYPRDPQKQISTIEEEFQYNYENDNCYLWFYDNDLPGYSWYFPKADGYVNVGIGGKSKTLKSRGETIKKHWDAYIEKLEKRSLIKGYSFKPIGYTYYLKQDFQNHRIGNAFILGDAAGLATIDMGEGIGPAVRSGILAAKSITEGVEYSFKSISKFSLFQMLFPWWYRRSR